MADLRNQPALLLRGLVKVRDLEYFEGPMLSEFRRANGDIYLYSWVDTWADGNRWLVFRVNARDLALYTHGRLSLQGLVRACPDPAIYLVDCDDEGHIKDANFSPLNEIPRDYMPADDDPSTPAEIAVTRAFQGDDAGASTDILISEQWELDDLAEFSRKYTDTYAFLYSYGHHAAVKPRALDKDYSIKDGLGFESQNFFRHLARHIPSDERPQVQSIQYQSPGLIRIQANSDVARLIPKAVESFATNRKDLSRLSATVYALTHPKKDDQTPVAMRDELTLSWTKTFVERLGSLDFKLMLDNLGTPTRVAEAALAYYRRIRRIFTYEIDDKAEIL